MKQNIIVLGSAGNLGMYYIDYLLKNLDMKRYEIIATGTKTKYSFKFYDGRYEQVDITNANDFDKLPQTNVYAIVDFAGVLPAYLEKDDPHKYIDVNVTGTLNVLEYARKVKADRIIYTHTWAEMNGYLKDGLPLEPYAPRKPIFKGDHAVYTVTKCAAVDLIECYHQIYKIKNFIFKLPNIYMYSPEKYYYVDGKKSLISYRYMIQNAIEGKDIELWGDPDLGKDIIYVKDLCQMIYKAMMTNKVTTGQYNAGTGIKTTMREQVEGMVKVFSPKNNPSKIIECPEKKNCDDFVMDISNIKEDLGYEPEYDYISYLEDYKREMEAQRFTKE